MAVVARALDLVLVTLPLWLTVGLIAVVRRSRAEELDGRDRCR